MSSEQSAAKAAPDFHDGETLYRMLFENSLDGLMLTAPDGTILDANPSACRMLGRTKEEIMAGGRAGVIDVSDPRLPGLLEERARTGKVHGELRAFRSDGRCFPVDISSVVFQDPDGNSRTCMILRDISERKAAEAERERLIAELQEALKKVKLLSGLLPICSGCKKIRDAEGHWQRIESYIRKHSEADFTHGICPECKEKLYPGE